MVHACDRHVTPHARVKSPAAGPVRPRESPLLLSGQACRFNFQRAAFVHVHVPRLRPGIHHVMESSHTARARASRRPALSWAKLTGPRLTRSSIACYTRELSRQLYTLRRTPPSALLGIVCPWREVHGLAGW